MVSQHVHFGPSIAFNRVKGLMLSLHYGKCFSAYGKTLLGATDGLFYHSPNILERKFRNGIEYYQVIHTDGWEEFRLTHTSVMALIDGLEQVRDVVGRYCDSMAHIEDYSPWSPLYNRFRESSVAYPLEPLHTFEPNWWSGSFSSETELQQAITKVQVWAMWMIAALHCLALYDGKDNLELPPLSCAHLAAAQHAWHEEELRAGRVQELQIEGLKSPPPSDDGSSMVSCQELDSDIVLETAPPSSSSGSSSLRRRRSTNF